jgi:Ca2+-binding RTX toxin-like protein
MTRCYGGNNDDSLNGGDENDALYGDAGNDTLTGHWGSDTLTGGAGADKFAYSNASETSGLSFVSRDVIADFSWPQGDKIDVSAMDANSSVGGNQAFTWIGTAAFTAAGQLRYDQSGGNTFVRGNTGGDLSYEFAIMVTGLVPFIGSDFVL